MHACGVRSILFDALYHIHAEKASFMRILAAKRRKTDFYHEGLEGHKERLNAGYRAIQLQLQYLHELHGESLCFYYEGPGQVYVDLAAIWVVFA